MIYFQKIYTKSQKPTLVTYIIIITLISVGNCPGAMTLRAVYVRRDHSNHHMNLAMTSSEPFVPTVVRILFYLRNS
uniref:Uncharacterized protein n=1 Tax=Pararge aegeria TaxID=116150 RepID=S4P8M5_9NEOP